MPRLGCHGEFFCQLPPTQGDFTTVTFAVLLSLMTIVLQVMGHIFIDMTIGLQESFDLWHSDNLFSNL